MREFDRDGLDVASFQGQLFEESLDYCETSSPIFLRRFFRSRYAEMVDNTPVAIQPLFVPDAFEEIEKQYGKSSYGKIRYNRNAMYWLGYITRYICYTRQVSSRLFYHLFDVKKIYSLYEAYHTQSEEWCVARILELFGYDEKTLDMHERLKSILRKRYHELSTQVSE